MKKATSKLLSRLLRSPLGVVATIALTLSIFAGIAPIHSFAEDGENNIVYFEQNPDSVPTNSDGFLDINRHDVMLNGIPKTIYCLQANYDWPQVGGINFVDDDGNIVPSVPTGFIKATDNPLLDEDEAEISIRLMFVGYPNNSLGYLDDIIAFNDNLGHEKLAINNHLADFTQHILWYLLRDSGIVGNEYGKQGEVFTEEELILYYTGEDNIEDVEEDNIYANAIKNIITFAKEGVLPEEPDGQITISGSGTMTKQGDMWHTGILKIVEPENANLIYIIELPEGVEAYVVDGENTVTVEKVAAGQEFYLVTEDENKRDKKSVTVKATAIWPHELAQYEPVENNESSNRAYQTMLCIDVSSTELICSLELSAQETSPEVTPSTEPGVSPTPDSSNEPEVSPSPTSSAAPSTSPNVEPSENPSQTPTSSATPAPTSAPTNTPAPNNTPTPSNTPSPSTAPAPTTTPAPSQPANSNTANTGDSFNAVGLVALLVVSAIAVVALLILRKKNSK